MKKINLSIFKREGEKKGKTLAVFSGVHGNEQAGVLAMRKILKNIKIARGKVFFVFANPPAIEKNVRQINKNLNRCFLKGNQGRSFEDKRARELMKILDKCEALLDLHASPNKENKPFIICEKVDFSIADKLDFEIISFGWDKIEPGATDGYMHKAGKKALCLECGPISESKKYSRLVEKSIWQFLKYFGLIDSKIKFSKRKQRFAKVTRAVHKKSDNFALARKFKDFESLSDGELIATDDKTKFFAKKDEFILFAKSDSPIGGEAFVIGSWIDES